MTTGQEAHTPKKMVCGFAFNHEKEPILTYRTASWWYGKKYNGLGGAIETGEGIRSAMQRTFLRDAGVDVDCNRWSIYHHEHFRNGNEVYYLTVALTERDSLSAFRHATVGPFLLWEERNHFEWLQDGAPGVSYLLPMAFEALRTPLLERPL